MKRFLLYSLFAAVAAVSLAVAPSDSMAGFLAPLPTDSAYVASPGCWTPDGKFHPFTVNQFATRDTADKVGQEIANEVGSDDLVDTNTTTVAGLIKFLDSAAQKYPQYQLRLASGILVNAGLQYRARYEQSPFQKAAAQREVALLAKSPVNHQWDSLEVVAKFKKQ